MKSITAFKKQDLKVSQFAPNHLVISTKHGEAFQSYDSVVALFGDDGQITLGKDWDYSRTTIKYLGKWLGSDAKEIRQKLADGVYKYDEELK